MTDTKKLEEKWQKQWEDKKSFALTDKNFKQKPYYALEMFPYPSGNIHMGHVRNYTLGDVVARFKRASGYDVLHPMGWDAFGLPAENAAIERGVLPHKWTYQNIEQMKGQLKKLGLSVDWGREFATCDPVYYGHEQKIFLDFYKKGLVYRKETYVNFDPVEQTILANEQVVNGRGWRSGALIEKKKIHGWFAKITQFADMLEKDLEHMEGWPEKVRLMQKNWIGRSVGLNFTVDLFLEGAAYEAFPKLDIFTTRPETLYGMTYCAIAAEHPIALALAEHHKELAHFIEEMRQSPLDEESLSRLEKKGVKTSIQIKHPLEDRFVPLYVVNFVMADYGTGAIFCCPSHDERDHAFALAYDLPMLQVLEAREGETVLPFVDDGVMINSGPFNGMSRDDCRAGIMDKMIALGCGEKKTSYRLRDWGISRQRYWGCPIPLIYCNDCGAVPVPEGDLPLLLPNDVVIDGKGNPLDHHPTWKHTTCPTCGKAAQRETDTLDTFFESSWYFVRFCDAHNKDVPFDPAIVSKYLPVDCYIGGVEHAILHLLYARFFVLALKHVGYDIPSLPFTQLFTQGMVCHHTFKDEDGKWVLPSDVTAEGKEYLDRTTGKKVVRGPAEKMSKSKKNIVDPAMIFEHYGVDAARFFVLSDTPPERDFEWDDAGIAGATRFLQRVMAFGDDLNGREMGQSASREEGEGLSFWRHVHRAISQVTGALEKFHFNKALAELRELFAALTEYRKVSSCNLLLMEGWGIFLQLLAPFAPHIADEYWAQLKERVDARDIVCKFDIKGDFIFDVAWPKADDTFLAVDSVTVAIQVNGKLRGTIDVAPNLSEDELKAHAIGHPNVLKHLDGKDPKKVIVIKGKVVNVVV